MDWGVVERLFQTGGERPRLEEFAHSLYETNITTNLTRVPREEFVCRHIVDSLLVIRFVPEGATVLDIGCGPGFPCWPLALFRPDLMVTALDSSGKMLRFLRQHPLPNLEVVQGRAEEIGWREHFDVVTGRAVAPLAVQAEVSLPAVRVGGLFIPFRTPRERAAIESFPVELLGAKLDECHLLDVPECGFERCFPIFAKVRKTPRKFPRSWAQIRANPLA